MGKSQETISGEDKEILKELFNKALRKSGITDKIFEELSAGQTKRLQITINNYLSGKEDVDTRVHAISYDYYRGYNKYRKLILDDVEEIPYQENMINSVVYYVTENEELTWPFYRSNEKEKGVIHKGSKRISTRSEVITSYVEELALEKSIGFKKNEKIKYQISYGKWLRATTSNYQAYQICEENRVEDRDYVPETCSEIHDEENLEPIKSLLDRHFSQCEKRGQKHSFSFILADFGKGKSVLMSRLASEYAQRLIASEYSRDEFFPIYINLRNTTDCLSKGAGIIDTYLRRYPRFGVEDLARYQNIVFLLDSFDEVSAVLTAQEIVEDILPVLEKRGNPNSNLRIVIATRPISSLTMVLDDERLHPYYQNEEYYGDTPMFIHAFGFTESQVNDFFSELGCSYTETYQKLLEKDVLRVSELRRPLLSYILYKVIQNGRHLDQLSRISIYLSFINYLTIEAKYIGDPEINRIRRHKGQSRHSFHQQAIFRSILHGMAVLWLMNRSGIRKSGNEQRIDLNSENLEILLLGGKETKSSSMNRGVLVDYLSNSYFGEKGESFNFKHQSFAEILLAEYYIKVLLVFALEGKKVYELDSFLAIGRPSRVAIEFFRELLKLLKKSSEDADDREVMNARRLLSPLITSIAIEENNQLYSQKIDSIWRTSINKVHFEKAQEFPSDEVFRDWPVDFNVINAITDLCEERFNQERISSYDTISTIDSGLNSLAHLNKSLSGTLGQEHIWILLIAGNYLHNDLAMKQFFGNRIRPDIAFKLIKMARFGEDDLLNLWDYDLFIGLDMSKEEHGSNLSHIDLSQLDLSYTYFKDFHGSMIDFSGCRFDKVIFEGFEVEYCNFSNATFKDICIKMPDNYQNMEGYSGVHIHPTNQINSRRQFPDILIRYLVAESSENILPFFISEKDKDSIFTNLASLWKWIFKNREISKDHFLKGFILTSSVEAVHKEFYSFLSSFYDENVDDK